MKTAIALILFTALCAAQDRAVVPLTPQQAKILSGQQKVIDDAEAAVRLARNVLAKLQDQIAAANPAPYNRCYTGPSSSYWLLQSYWCYDTVEFDKEGKVLILSGRTVPAMDTFVLTQ